MYKAFDTLFQCEISADSATKSGITDEFRYECLCCGEEVYLAAKDSIHKSSHFRHRSGNNDTECENYLGGQYNKPTHLTDLEEKIKLDYYYNSRQHRFYSTIKLTPEQIEKYTSENASIAIKSDRTKKPFYEITISSTFFAPERPFEISLSEYSNVYYFSLGQDEFRGSSLFSTTFPIIFKIIGNDETDFRAKFIKSKKIYTENKYCMIFAKENFDINYLKNHDEVKIYNIEKFSTMKSKIFHSIVFSIVNKDQYIENVFGKYGINIETSEKCLPLWPPMYTVNDQTIVTNTRIYIYSTFPIIEKSTSNINQSRVKYLEKNISAINFINIDTFKVKKNNVDETFLKDHNSEIITEYLSPKSIYLSKYKCKTENTFLFNGYYFEELPIGKKLYLMDNYFISHFDKNNYCVEKNFPKKTKETTPKSILYDAIKHYKLYVSFEKGEVFSNNKDIQNYLYECEKTGYINLAVKRLIEEGVL